MRIDPTEMTDDDLDMEIESLVGYMEECARIEQGICTKDAVRLRRLRAERLRRIPAAIAA